MTDYVCISDLHEFEKDLYSKIILPISILKNIDIILKLYDPINCNV